MSGRSRVALALIVTAGLALAWSSSHPALLQEHGRWEYCTLKPAWQTDQDTAEARIDYFTTGERGYRTEVVQARRTWETLDAMNDNLPENAFRRAMARVGAEGWEVVTVVSDESGAMPRVVYFKRRMP